MLKTFGWAIGLTVAAVVVALVFGSPEAALIVVLLGVLEISLSFDNAVVNAKVLNRMHPVWQRLFLTVGIIIAVFGMRLVLPIVIVAVSAGLDVGSVVDLAINDSVAYGEELEESEALIYAFGGTFLLMIFLEFVFDSEREVLWLTPIEKVLQFVGRVDALATVVALGGIYLMSEICPPEEKERVLVAGIFGLITYLAVAGLDGLFEASMEHREDVDHSQAGKAGGGKMTVAVFKAGVFSFLYLEVLDASFSFDGVIGAFAISDDILVIALGLGIGAFWIRSLTIYLVRAGTLSEYVYLEHGAHWAIGVLAGIMLLSVDVHVPEVVTGLTGVAFILAAFASSLAYRKRHGGHAIDVAADGVETEAVLGDAPR